MPSLPLPELPWDLLRLYQLAQISQSISLNAGTTKSPMLGAICCAESTAGCSEELGFKKFSVLLIKPIKPS